MLPTSEGCHGGARRETRVNKKCIRNSLNICGATPLMSQNHVLTTSVALTRLSNFATLRNKIVKNLKITMEIDHLRSPGVLCQL